MQSKSVPAWGVNGMELWKLRSWEDRHSRLNFATDRIVLRNPSLCSGFPPISRPIYLLSQETLSFTSKFSQGKAMKLTHNHVCLTSKAQRQLCYTALLQQKLSGTHLSINNEYPFLASL